MKAKLFMLGNQEELVLANGTSYKNEDFNNSTEMVEEATSQQGEKLEIKKINLGDIKKKTTAALQQQLDKLEGLERNMVIKVLSDRGKLPTPKAVPNEKVDKKLAAKKEKTEKVEKAEKAEKLPEEPKAANPKDKKIVTSADVELAIATAKAAKVNIGKPCKFVPFRGFDFFEGIIKATWVDKRYAVALYSIKTTDGTMKNKVCHSDELKIG